MTSYIIYYSEANIVCIILFAIMLLRDVFSVDRQEKQIKYDHALVAFMLYFATDAVWAAVIAGLLPRNLFTVLPTNFANYGLMAAITYTWLRYVMAAEQVPGRDSRRTRFAIQFPFYIATLALFVTYLVKPDALLDDALNLRPAYHVFQIGVPIIYIAAVVLYTVRRAIVEENPIERSQHLFVGFFPLMVVGGGLLQILVLPETPVFCFCCAILMEVFYIHSMEGQISTDPLTGLNNRGQLVRYTLQKANLRREGRRTFVVMIDINDFKEINDTYGHAEGDRALILAANSIKSAMRRQSMPMFLARYGGDEFILIVHPTGEEEVGALVREIRSQIEQTCLAENTPYRVSIGAGFDELRDGDDTFQDCMQRADDKLYQEKTARKA